MTTSQDLMAEAFSDYFAGFKPHEKPNYYDSLYGFEAGYQSATLRQEARIKALTDALEQIKHSITQMQMPGNDKRREVLLIQNTVAEALTLAKEAT